MSNTRARDGQVDEAGEVDGAVVHPGPDHHLQLEAEPLATDRPITGLPIPIADPPIASEAQPAPNDPVTVIISPVWRDLPLDLVERILELLHHDDGEEQVPGLEFEYLPRNVLFRIQQLLPVSSQARFRNVCRSWRDVSTKLGL